MIINHTKEAFELQGKAREFAIKAHGDQLYGKQPYVHHLDMVSAILHDMQRGGWCIPHESFVAVWLHDVLEDTDAQEDEIRQLFGDKVTNIVKCLTKDVPLDYDKYIHRIQVFHAAYVIKIADTLANLDVSVIKPEPGRIKKYTKQLTKLVMG